MFTVLTGRSAHGRIMPMNHFATRDPQAEFPIQCIPPPRCPTLPVVLFELLRPVLTE